VNQRNASPPRSRLAAGPRSGAKTGLRPDPNGALPGAEQLRVDNERTPEPSSSPTGATGVARAEAAARQRRPKTGQALGTSGLIADWPFTRIQPGGECDSTAAEHEHQERGNPPRALLPRAGGAGRCAEPQARGMVGWPKQPKPGVMPGIRRRGPRWLAGSGASRSAHVMSPTGTSRYEWGSLPPRESEQGACKLQTRSFQAAGRAGTASAAADRGRYPCQGPASEEPCEGKLSCTVCAVRRVSTSPAQPGNTRRRCMGYQLTHGRKANGTRACWEKGVTAGRRCTAGRVRPGRQGEGSTA
jgi:hypothetical protein